MARKGNKKTGKIRILVADCQPIVRKGLTLLMNEQQDLEVIAEADSISSVFKAIGTSKPDIVVIDLSLGAESDFEIINALVTKAPALPVLVFSEHAETQYAERVLRAGAKGYVMKQEDITEVIDAIRKILHGYIYISEIMRSRILAKFVGDNDSIKDDPVGNSLTEREIEVFRLIGKGMSTSKVATRLGISSNTVSTHRKHIKEKLDLKSAAELLLFAGRWIDAEHQDVLG